MNYGRVTFILGTFLQLLAGIMLIPLLCALPYGETGNFTDFLIPSLIATALGFLLRFLGRRAPRSIYRREGLLVVVGSWILASLIGGLPLLLSGGVDSMVDSTFEAMSGLTTTGSTILTDIEALPRSILFWRSMTHWLGGMGIVLLFVAILPALGVGGRLLYEFEVPGLESDDLKPRIRATALALWKVYCGITVCQIIALLICGLDLFDAMVHTFGTVATGGFSSYNSSVAAFNSPAVEIVITIFMFAAGVNFALYYRLPQAGFRAILKSLEFRVYVSIMLFMTVICTTVLCTQGDAESVGRATLDSAFTVVSVGTTTGFGTADFDRWPDLLRILMVLLMFVGGSTGSTAGGLKVMRLILVAKVITHEIRRFVYPNRVRMVRVQDQTISDDMMRNVLAFFALAILIFAMGTVTMAALGLGLTEATTSVVATLWNIGPGLGLVGPTQNFAAIPEAGKVLLTGMMLLGRLEILTVVVLLTPSLYRD